MIKANGGQVICDAEVTGIDVEGGGGRVRETKEAALLLYQYSLSQYIRIQFRILRHHMKEFTVLTLALTTNIITANWRRFLLIKIIVLFIQVEHILLYLHL